jgi:secondary thiamine-phosphate synthase enzyme
METISVKSGAGEELIEITGEVSRFVKKSGVKEGICIIYTPHTTAAITINENADRTVKSDILKGLRHIGFETVRFDHSEGNSPSHLKSSIIGCSETVIINRGSLELGTWQGIFFCEFDGPRSRKVYIKTL